MRFCQLLSAIIPDIVLDTDVPAGDIGVGGREVIHAGMMKKLSNRADCVFTGGLSFGGR
jgi:glutamate dehydrogenase (NADP+)